MSTLQPHQQRVVQEVIELDAKADALSLFIVGDIYPTLAEEDRELLRQQFSVMMQLKKILGERIKRFGIKDVAGPDSTVTVKLGERTFSDEDAKGRQRLDEALRRGFPIARNDITRQLTVKVPPEFVFQADKGHS